MHQSLLLIFLPVVLALCLCAYAAQGAELPEAKTGGAGKGPIAILFLSKIPQMDPAYARQLTDEGFTYAVGSYYDAYKPEFLRKFNVFVIDYLPQAGQEYDVFGQELLPYRANLNVIWQCAKDGAGVLIYTNQADIGGKLAARWNDEMRRWGIQMRQACIRDPQKNFAKWQDENGLFNNAIIWTENLTKHPITAGLHRIYYPSANMRWDDCYTAPPLVGDANWTPLVKAMPGSISATQVDGQWIEEPDKPTDLTLAAVRTTGAGRMGALSIHPTYTHRWGYTANPKDSEMGYGVVDGITLDKGDGAVPSDTGKMLSTMYRWLAGDSAANGFGGYRTGEALATLPVMRNEIEKTFKPVLDFDTLQMPPSWKHTAVTVKVGNASYWPEAADPRVPGEIQYFKALIGVHTGLSDGKGSVAEYAAAVKQAGYSCVAFTENYERLSVNGYTQLIKDCQANSTETFKCLPGYEILDPANNSYLIINAPHCPPASWLSADGKRLVKTQFPNILFGNHFVIAHRPESSPLPVERIKHYSGLSVFTYRGGKLVDNSLHAYDWQTVNGSNPIPVVVHELFSPQEVAAAAASGYQQIMPADTVAYAVGYFSGSDHFFECPVRAFLSEGPIVYDWVINPKDYGPVAENRMHFRVDIGVRSEVPLKVVTLYDGYTAVRRWLPNATDFHVRADFQHARQYGLYVVAEDAKGRKVITSSMRTISPRYHVRCGDRQNWLGSDTGIESIEYTGTYLSDGLDIRMPIRGTAEGSSLFTEVPGTCMAVKINHPFSSSDLVLLDAVLDEKYSTALFSDVGFDAMPSQASKPSSVYNATMRRASFTAGKAGQPNLTLLDFDITLKRDVEPVNPAGLFPALGGLRGNTLAMLGGDGKFTQRAIAPDEVIDIPVGALAGGYIVLSPGLRIDHGQFGFAPPPGAPGVRYAGTHLTARFLIADSKETVFDRDPRATLAALGLAGETPYTLQLTRGTLRGGGFPAVAVPAQGGIAGTVSKTATLPFTLPLQIDGVNPNWTAGIWQEGVALTCSGIFERTAWPRLDVSRKGAFYAGNLLTADNPELVLEIVKWTADAIKVEAHNPTDHPIDATITTPAEITGYQSLKQTVHVPAGSTIYVTN